MARALFVQLSRPAKAGIVSSGMRIPFGITGVMLIACNSSTTGPQMHGKDCSRDSALVAAEVAECLRNTGVILPSVAARLDSTVLEGTALSMALRERGQISLSVLVDSSIERVPRFFHSGLLADSARVDRVIDHLQVTQQFASGLLKPNGSRYATPVTPGILWHYYPTTGAGIFAHPLETVQSLGSQVPDSLYADTDSLRRAASALWQYAEWYERDGRRFPMWVYLFKNDLADPTGLGYHHMIKPPWRSSMPQGDMMRLFTILYRRTHEKVWADRARAVLLSFDTPWSRGGVRLDDTTNGYWFEEALPEAMIWNGSMQALVDVGVYTKEFPDDSLGARLWRRGLEAAYRFTPDYDTGTWLRYSRVQGNVAAHYRNFCVALALALGRLSGDTTTWNAYARRWASYAIPGGTCVGGPCADATPPRVP